MLPDSLCIERKESFLKLRHLSATQWQLRYTRVDGVRVVNCTVYGCEQILKGLHVSLRQRLGCVMASKRAQAASSATDKKKKKKKSCEETAEICSVVEEEQVKRTVKEAWSSRTQYSQGE